MNTLFPVVLLSCVGNDSFHETPRSEYGSETVCRHNAALLAGIAPEAPAVR